MFDWNSLLGHRVSGADGTQYYLGSVSAPASEPACFRTVDGKSIARIWSREDSAMFAEVKRRIRDITTSQESQFGLLPFTELTIDRNLFGYVTRLEPRKSSLTDAVLWDRQESWLSWYSRFPLQRRLAAACAMSSLVFSWSGTGYGRCEWPLNSLLVSEDGSIKADDPESFSRSTRARLIARGDQFALAPELLNGSRQPDALADVFSLAVVVYALLRTVHPFGGSGYQADTTKEWVETASATTFENLVPKELVFTAEMHRLFTRCFVDGREFRFARPSVDEWRLACENAIDRTALCGSCGAGHLVHSPEHRAECQFCGERLPNLMALDLFDAALDRSVEPNRTRRRASGHMLVCGTGPVTLYGRHCRPQPSYQDSGQVFGRLVPTGREFLIENASTDRFFVFKPGADRSVGVEPGAKVNLPVGSRIFFARPLHNRNAKGARFVRCGVTN
jgi:hypothetical protein